MKVIRYDTFETNSSSCHSLTHVSKEELKEWSANQALMCIWLPDCEGYHEEDIGHTYKIMSIEDAMAQYNKAIDDAEKRSEEYKKQFPENAKYVGDFPFAKYDDEDKFYDDMEARRLETDSIFGNYMTFGGFMSQAVIENDMNFDVTWWNNC